MHHKRRRAKNRRSGCLMCKPWKVNGHGKDRIEAHQPGNYRRRLVAMEKIEETCREYPEKA